MKNLHRKLQLLFYPLLLVAAGFIGLYTLLNWLLIIQTGDTTISENVMQVWTPLVLVWLPLFKWIKPNLKF